MNAAVPMASWLHRVGPFVVASGADILRRGVTTRTGFEIEFLHRVSTKATDGSIMMLD
jgi:hypothetical protein